MGIDDVAKKFQPPDLHAALSDYISCIGDSEGFVSPIGGHHVAQDGCELPFEQLEIWSRVQLQGKSYHYLYDILPPQTVNVLPPMNTLSHRCSDAVLVNLDPTANWPHSGLHGMSSFTCTQYLGSLSSYFIRACCCTASSHYAHCSYKSPSF